MYLVRNVYMEGKWLDSSVRRFPDHPVLPASGLAVLPPGVEHAMSAAG